MTIKLKPHPCAPAIRKMADILERGEQEMWSLDGTPLNVVVLRTNTFPIVPNDSHPHYRLWNEWQELVKSGAVERGEAWIEFHGDGKTSQCEWRADREYKIVRKQEKKRLIDWAKMPKGVMTNYGWLISFEGEFKERRPTLLDAEVWFYDVSLLRLAPAEQQPWILWQGGECPVPNDIIVEVEFRNGGSCVDEPNCFRWGKTGTSGDIIAYRIAGLAQGWTDNPEEAA